MVIVYSILATVILYVLYIWIFSAKKHADRQSKPVKQFIYVLMSPVLLVGYVIDILYNVTIGTVVFWDLPQELTLTSRLKRYIADEPKNNFRYQLSYWMCKYMLHPFDKDHCGRLP